MNVTRLFAVVISSVIITACGGGNSGSKETNSDNKKPYVDVGDDIGVSEGETVIFSAEASDPDGRIVEFEWSQVSGKSVQISNSETLNAEFTAPSVKGEEILIFELKVTDNGGASSQDRLSITVHNKANLSVENLKFDEYQEDGVIRINVIANDLEDNASVDYKLFSFRAKKHEDFEPEEGTLSFSPEENKQVLTIRIYHDYTYEANETFILELANEKNISLKQNDYFVHLLEPKPKGVLTDSGVKDCYDTFSNQGDCPVEGFPGQDAEYGDDLIANEHYKKIGESGEELEGSADTWACVLDGTTGLMWEIKKDDGSTRDRDLTKLWWTTNPAFIGNKNSEPPYCHNDEYCTTELYEEYVNSIKLCGYSDWRTPKAIELFTLYKQTITYPFINKDYFVDMLNAQYNEVCYQSMEYDLFLGYNRQVCFGQFPFGRASSSDGARLRLVRGRPY